MAAMVVVGFIFMVLLVKLLAGNGNKDDFFTGVRNAERCASRGVAPLPRLLGLITKAPQRLLRGVSELQSFVARVVNDLRRTGRNKFVGHSRSFNSVPTPAGRQERFCFRPR